MVEYRSAFFGGSVLLPPSKSVTHRALLCAALSRKRCMVSPVDPSKDMEATLSAIRALGVGFQYDRSSKNVCFSAETNRNTSGTIDCLESGSTLRFLLPIAAALGGDWLFIGSGRLPERPLSVYQQLFPEHGVQYHPEQPGKSLPLRISGRLTPGEFRLPGNISSQFITGLLFALPLLSADSEIILTTPLESVGYVELTLSVLRDFGIQATKTERGLLVPGGQTYQAADYLVEADWSQAAFYLCMAVLAPAGQPVRLLGLNRQSVQGDRACLEAFRQFGLQIFWDDDVLVAQNPQFSAPYHGLTGQTIDVSQIPDLVPALAVCGALSKGETRLIGAGRLRLKESDRLSAMENAINRLGGHCRSDADSLTIHGVPMLHGGTVSGENDHRIVMAMASAALCAEHPVCVTDEQSIQKSYPGFFIDFQSLGGKVNVIHLG